MMDPSISMSQVTDICGLHFLFLSLFRPGGTIQFRLFCFNHAQQYEPQGFSFFRILEVYGKCPEVARNAAFTGHPAMLLMGVAGRPYRP